MTKWTTENIPSQRGRTAIVTGTGGIGYETALELCRAGADVILAGRNPTKGRASIDRLQAEVPNARVRFGQLDLASLASVRAFGDRMQSELERLDILVNNAGVMTPPDRRETSDGFELQLGTNYLGHFALTAHLLPLLRKSSWARVVSLSSVAVHQGKIDFDDLNAETAYKPMPVYSQSKLACLMFAIELQRRSWSESWGIRSIGAHPGVSRTDLLMNGPGERGITRRIRTYLPFLFQPAAQGALPILYAATSDAAEPGGYYGPDRLRETRGHPAPAKVPRLAQDEKAAAKLWRLSEQLTKVRFEAPEMI
ncbi:SDR family oxidoreductase [Pelagovum pacificum]|uniref:SDR family NAD(P)-dependent oxidoreductase n=1 Tax=Pelagovum pacificum TaxID=2588711 RepID=A0A5C5GBY0_9RHOB|nr:SDR family oxidoreductase [Pelagovum pacificum]QQA41171.1 SDR family oxidoreductase [Pelagovum pacificum]TNY32020.1 SDR family NAD(P)-dependent oxidoreductase [Pelagovum pacificum]